MITGAAKSSGRAKTLPAHGVHMVIADTLPDLHKTFESIKKKHRDNRGYLVEVDVPDENAVRELIAGAVKKSGRINIIVNNAGMHLKEGPVAEFIVGGSGLSTRPFAESLVPARTFLP